MIGLIGSILAHVLMGIVAVASAAAAGFLLWESAHTVWLRRRQQRERERARREFWGYE